MPKVASKAKRGGHTRRQSPYSSEHVAAAKEHWSKLTQAEQLQVLRFEDAKLVEQLYEAQQALFFADFECCICGIRNQEEIRRNAGLHFFDVEGIVEDDGSLRPTAFFTKPALLEKPDLFEFFEQRLGHAFLSGAPGLPRHDWPSCFDVPPSSWSDFVRRVLQLVELAIFESWQSKQTLAKQGRLDDEEAAAAAAAEELMNSEERVKGTARISKKSRKARLAAAAATSSEHAGVAEGTTLLPVPQLSSDLELATTVSQGTEHFTISTPREAPTEDILLCSQALRASAREARIEAEVQARDARRSTQPPWLLADCCADACVLDFLYPEETDACNDSPHSFRTIVKNTFVELVPVDFDFNTRADIVESGAADLGVELPASPKALSEASLETLSVWSDDETVLAENQKLRLSASAARIGAVVQPSLTASQALRASAREARIQALSSTSWKSSRRRDAWVGSSWPAWQLLDGSSGEQWLEGFRTIVKNTFVDVEMNMPDRTSFGKRARSLPELPRHSVLGGA